MPVVRAPGRVGLRPEILRQPRRPWRAEAAVARHVGEACRVPGSAGRFLAADRG